MALPGWRRAHGDFGPVAAKLPRALVALDLPGFGASPQPDEAWSTASYAEVVAEVVAEVIGDVGSPVVVVGHSFGGRVAVRLAASRPGLVRGLVLSGVPLVSDPRRRAPAAAPRGYRLVRSLHRRGLVSEERLERARRRYGSADYRASNGVMRDVLVKAVNETYDDALAQLRCPVELVWADDDSEVPVEVAEEIRSRIAGARLTVCPGAGHLLPLTAPDALAEAIERVAGSVGPGT